MRKLHKPPRASEIDFSTHQARCTAVGIYRDCIPNKILYDLDGATYLINRAMVSAYRLGKAHGHDEEKIRSSKKENNHEGQTL